MKRKVFLMLAIMMMVTITLPLGVSANGEAEKYVPRVKEIFDIGEEYTDFSVFTHEYNGETTHDLSWRGDKDNISVEVDIEGNIKRYSKYGNRYGEEHSKFPKITKEEGLKKQKRL